jgi:hypothetical protein
VRDLRAAGLWVGGIEGHLLALGDELRGDRNGDGDQDDLVLLDWSAATRAVANGGLAIGSLNGSSGETALVTVVEASQGADLNGDGDREDFVLVLYDARTRASKVLRLAVADAEARLGPGGHAAALAAEQAHGADLNGDGDLLDEVLHAIDVAPENLAFSADA